MDLEPDDEQSLQQLRVTSDAIAQSSNRQKDFTYNISAEQQKLFFKDTAQLTGIIPTKVQVDLKIFNIENQNDQCLFQAQSKANIPITHIQIMATKRFERKNEPEHFKARQVTYAEIITGISSTRTINLYDFKGDGEITHFLKELSVNAAARIKEVKPNQTDALLIQERQKIIPKIIVQQNKSRKRENFPKKILPMNSKKNPSL
ncbi:MAG: hypothetical protein EZS28_006890 [Streblomastix strix]|uniref:Uncharacterized protein n=1 Tax=Streblomastix strix TaxID=222440 RepID=A0A5J4WR68_9EUKA|nr:MAG: hypothetical protein EZS28_006890 [Streblomastix strix]